MKEGRAAAGQLTKEEAFGYGRKNFFRLPESGRDSPGRGPRKAPARAGSWRGGGFLVFRRGERPPGAGLFPFIVRPGGLTPT